MLLATWDMEAMLDSLTFVHKAQWAQLTFSLSSWDQNSEHELVINRSLHGPQQVLREFFFSCFFSCFYGAPLFIQIFDCLCFKESFLLFLLTCYYKSVRP